jgi:outer membrane autotransporter protein
MGNVVKTDTASVPAALGQLAGDIHASIRSALIEDGRIVRDTVLDHVQFAGQGMSVWGAGFYSNGAIDSNGNASALDHNSSGFLAGVDMPFGNGFRAGIGGGVVSNNASEPGRASTASGNNGHIIAYAGWNDDALTLKLGGDYGWGDLDITRQVPALSETNKNSEYQRVAQVFGEAAYMIQADAAQIEPYIDIAHISARTGAFTEKGGLSALSGGATNEDATYATLGVRFSLADVKLSDTSIVPKLGIGWQHAFDRFAPDQMLTLQNAAQDFTVQGVSLGSDSAVIQAGVSVALSPDVLLDVGYDGAFSGTSYEHGLRGDLRWTF